MTIERSTDVVLITSIARKAWNRPGMTQDGVDIERFIPGSAFQYFVVREGEGDRALGLFAGFQQTPVCIEMHVLMLPECRGRRCLDAMRAGIQWLRENTPYRVATGSIPVYNKPMVWAALSVGFKRIGFSPDSVILGGRPYGRLILQREIGL